MSNKDKLLQEAKAWEDLDRKNFWLRYEQARRQSKLFVDHSKEISWKQLRLMSSIENKKQEMTKLLGHMNDKSQSSLARERLPQIMQRHKLYSNL